MLPRTKLIFKNLQNLEDNGNEKIEKTDEKTGSIKHVFSINGTQKIEENLLDRPKQGVCHGQQDEKESSWFVENSCSAFKKDESNDQNSKTEQSCSKIATNNNQQINEITENEKPVVQDSTTEHSCYSKVATENNETIEESTGNEKPIEQDTKTEQICSEIPTYVTEKTGNKQSTEKEPTANPSDCETTTGANKKTDTHHESEQTVKIHNPENQKLGFQKMCDNALTNNEMLDLGNNTYIVNTKKSGQKSSGICSSQAAIQWKLEAGQSDTKFRLKRVVNSQVSYGNSSDSEVIDDTDSDPDFDLKNEQLRREKIFIFNQSKRKRMKVSSNTPRRRNTAQPLTDMVGEINFNHSLVLPDEVVEIESENVQTQDENHPNYTNENVENTAELEPKRAKKRKSDPKSWIKNQAKFLRNTGQPYTSVSKNKTNFRGKTLQAPCDAKCKQKCSTRINENQRTTVFSKFWQLGDLARQREFVSKCIVDVKPEYRYPKNENRRLNKAFHLTINESKIRVCKKFFTATLDISDRFVRSVIEKMEDGFLAEDRRGKHTHHKKVAPEIKTGVRNHINSIPRIESHYLRNQTKREYIDGGKNLSDLYRDYKEDCLKNNLPFANKVMYSRIFNYEYNISFFQPKKDQCSVCAAYDLLSDEDKSKSKEKHELHLKEKNQSRIEKSEDKKKIQRNFVVACYDLQAVFPVPKGEVSLFYYKSKLNCLNFTICEMKNSPETPENDAQNSISNKKIDKECQSVYCYAWHEAEGNRGANELGSCVFKYLENRSKEIDDPDLEFVLYSDNCGGQQKNKFMLSMYAYAVTVLKIKSITHKFLIQGHTQNEGDSAHSIIERATKKTLRSGPIYVPSQYFSIIRNAKKTGTPFVVNEMCHTDFYDLKQLFTDCGYSTKAKQNKKKKTSETQTICEDDKAVKDTEDEHILQRRQTKPRSTSTKKSQTKKLDDTSTKYETESQDMDFKLNKAHIIKITKQDPTKIYYKNFYNEELFNEVIMPRKRSHPLQINQVCLKPAYNGKLEIGERKKSDIMSLFQANVIPQYYKEFYQNL